MEETLGKRIVSHRKRLGLTQDALAELLGVTAQAVSKWENDQSCPDIATLPKLAEIFGISTDELLGIERKDVHPAEIIREEPKEAESDGFRVRGGDWDFQWDGGRKSSLGLAVWVLLAGSLLLASYFLNFGASFWDILWPSGLLVFGIFGLFPRFSFFRLGCSLFGAYFLMENLNFAHFGLGRELLLPVLMLLFGGSLLLDSLRKPRHGSFHVCRDGVSVSKSSGSHCNYNGENFDCTARFGEQDYLIRLPRLSGGRAEVSFGELCVDLSACEEIADGCSIDLKCSFGELKLLVPRKYRVKPVSGTAFANVEVKGSPDAGSEGTITLNCDASFGEISVRYI